MGDWTDLAAADHLAAGQMQTFDVAGKRLLLVHADDGYHLIDEMCSHEDYSLALGCIKGSKIKCSLHGSYFDLSTGAALDEPADAPIRVYPLRIENGRIQAKVD